MIRRKSLPLLATAALLVSACTAPIRIRETKTPPPSHMPSSETLADFKAASRKDPAASAGMLLDGIRICERRIASGNAQAIEDYNYLVGRLVTHLERAKLEPWGTTVNVPGTSGTWRLSGREPKGFNALGRELLPTDVLAFSGKYGPPERILKPGIGAPIVGAVPGKVDLTQKIPPLETRYRGATVLVRTTDNRAEIEIINPFAVENVTFAGKSRPLATDYSSTVALALSRERVDKIGIARMLNPQRYANTARLNFIQPYDSKRIPLLLVHGLNDTPATWMPMYLGLMQDPEIRERYQFWAFSYPSGYPFLYSASLLRHELDRVARQHPDHKDIVVVGHSMGGILSRMMVADAGDAMWRGFFGKPPEQTNIPGHSRKLLEEAVVFNARPDIDRAIFICAPHRGSELASNWIGRLASRLVRAPALIADVAHTAINVATIDTAAMHLNRAPNSIDTLSPRNASVIATSKLPIHRTIPYHSLMGDRGKGNTPESSDGIVAYWSSHLDGAASEKIIPHHHGSHQHPEAIAEVRRILLMHAAGR